MFNTKGITKGYEETFGSSDQSQNDFLQDNRLLISIFSINLFLIPSFIIFKRENTSSVVRKRLCPDKFCRMPNRVS